MTLAPDRPAQPEQLELVTVTVDGFELRVPKGTLIIRAAEQLGVQIPRFCDHPLLDPIGACRQCLVEVEGQRKPVASCTTTVADGMVVKTQLTSPVADKAQQGTMELLLINHPLDCPVCDKGGECPLQNQALSNGRADSRFRDVKRTYPKPIAISSQVLLDRERCVLCARCTRFSEQVAGDPFIELFERGALEQVAVYEDEPFESYFSGNTVQICPVGALTSAAYRFRARPFDLMSTPGVCEHCASGCALRTDWRRGKVMRRLAGDDPAVNEEWNCDKGRFAFTYVNQADRLTVPLVRDEQSGELVEASWTEALERAAEGLREARDSGGVGVLPGGRLTVEDAYAYAKFARVALETNDVDARSPASRSRRGAGLPGRPGGRAGPGDRRGDVRGAGGGAGGAAGRLRAGGGVADRLPPAAQGRPQARPAAVRGRAVADQRGAQGLRHAAGDRARRGAAGAARARRPRPGGDAPVTALPAEAAGQTVPARWPPAGRSGHRGRRPGRRRRAAGARRGDPGRRAARPRCPGCSPPRPGSPPPPAPGSPGCRGGPASAAAVDAGALPTLLPGGRRSPTTPPAARSRRSGAALLPTTPGRDVAGDRRRGRRRRAVRAGGRRRRPRRPARPGAARAALDRVGFVVSLEIRRSVGDRARRRGAAGRRRWWRRPARSWTGRAGRGRSTATLRGTGALPDSRVLHALADEMDVDLGLPVGRGGPRRAGPGRAPPAGRARPTRRCAAADAGRPSGRGQAVLATWRQLLDRGSLQDGEPHLAGTAPDAGRGASRPATAAGARGWWTARR